MSLDFDDRVKTGNVHSVWWVVLRNDTFSGSSTATNTFRIATSEFVDTQSVPPLEFYHYPIIKNKPSIRTSIDLAKSTAKTSDVTLTCINEYLPSKYLSEELLYNGSTHYINQAVTIYQAFLGDTSGDETKIYTGRLIDVSHDHETCTLKIQSARPWDFISIPNVKTDKGTYEPVVYGEYTHNSSKPSSIAVVSTNRELFPLNYDRAYNGNIYYTAHQMVDGIGSGGGGGKGRLHLYNKTLDNFEVLYEYKNSSGSLSDWQDISVDLGTSNNFLYTSNKKRRAFLSWGTAVKSSTYGSTGNDNWSTSENLIDTDESTATGGGHAYGMTVDTNPYIDDTSRTLDLEIYPSTDPHCNVEPTCDIKYSLSGYKIGSNIRRMWLQYRAYGKWHNIHYQADLPTGSYQEIVGETTTTLNLWTDTCIQEDDPDTEDSPLTKDDHKYKMPDDFEFRIFYRLFTGYAHGNFAYYIYFCKFPLDLGYTAEGLMNESDPVILYCGADGLFKSGTQTTAWYIGTNVDELHEAHRDVLARFCGIKIANNTDAVNSGFGTGQTGGQLMDARNNWDVRWWANEPVPVKKVLEQMQYESCFVFMLNPADGKHRYIWVKDSYSSSDHTLGDNDLSGVKISHTPFSDLLTTMTVNFQKHPAENKYIQTETYQSGGSDAIRDKWNIQDKEGILEVNLDMLVKADATDDVQLFADYYFKIFGDIKIIVSGEIINPAKWGVEVGEIVDFSTSLEPYGETWSGKYFMITDVTRKIDSVSIKCREVG